MSQRSDCVVVGYAEGTGALGDLALAAEQPRGDLPPPIRSLLRTTVSLDGACAGYLDALSAARRAGGHGSGAYTVSELPSLGTLYLANYLEERGHRASFVNSFTFERDELAALLARGTRSVAITTTFYMAPAPVIEIVRFVRAHAPEVPIVVGGPLIDNACRAAAGAAPDRLFDRLGADVYIWEAQGEATLAAVVSALARGAPPDGLPNVYTRAGGSWRMERRWPENNDLDGCAVRWKRFSPAELGPTVSTRTARSCAFECAFCDYPARAGALALADVSTVERELEELAGLGVRRVAFIDDTFNVPAKRFRVLLEMMVRRDFGIEWFSYFRCGHARDESVYDLMVASGCRGVLLGIESGDDGVLASMDKRASTEAYRSGLEQLRRRGIFTHASFVVGFPGETDETVSRTIDFIDETRPDTFAVNHWYYLHSTPVHRRAAEFGLTGEGHTWSHRTMDSAGALEAADRIFESVRGSAWMPVADLDFWGVPYLLGKGMTPAEVVTFLELARPLTLAARTGGPPAAPAAGAQATAEEEFRTFCAGLALEPARYDVEGSRDDR